MSKCIDKALDCITQPFSLESPKHGSFSLPETVVSSGQMPDLQVADVKPEKAHCVDTNALYLDQGLQYRQIQQCYHQLSNSDTKGSKDISHNSAMASCPHRQGPQEGLHSLYQHPFFIARNIKAISNMPQVTLFAEVWMYISCQFFLSKICYSKEQVFHLFHYSPKQSSPHELQPR